MNNLQKLAQQRNDKEEELHDALSKLDNYGGECHCERKEGTADLIHKGDFDEVFTYCLSCGGVVV